MALSLNGWHWISIYSLIPHIIIGHLPYIKHFSKYREYINEQDRIYGAYIILGGIDNKYSSIILSSGKCYKRY